MNKTIALINKVELKNKIISATKDLVMSPAQGKDWLNFFNQLDITLKIGG